MIKVDQQAKSTDSPTSTASTASITRLDDHRERRNQARQERQQRQFLPANPHDPRSYVGSSFLDDLDYDEPFDLLAACDREEKRTNKEGESEWKKENTTHCEMHGFPQALGANIESLLGPANYSQEKAIAALIRYTFERQERNCRLKRWWIGIRAGVLSTEQTFEREQHYLMIHAFITEHKLRIPDFGSARKGRKFKMPESLQKRIQKTASQLGYSFSEYCQYLLLWALSECEGVKFRGEMRERVLEIHTGLEERIRIIVAHFKALRISPCDSLKEALREVDLEDYESWEG